jgi:hypothetical protein
MNKSKKIIAVGAAIILFIGGSWYFLGQRQHESQDVKLEKAKGKETESDSEKQAKVEEKLTAIEESRKTLETDKKVSDGGQIESLKNALRSGFNYLSSVDSSERIDNGDSYNHLQISSKTMLDTLYRMIKAGYTYDESTVEVYKSDSDNVLQFVYEMKKDGEEAISFAGNYVIGTEQVEVANMHGSPTGLASPTSGPQDSSGDK